MTEFPAKKLFWVTIFGIAFAMIESAIVIYLRELYYPEGFSFPLQLSGIEITSVELFRELATMVLLISIAVVAGRGFKVQFAWFVYTFAIWDIFYYVFLYVFLQWPASLFTWDIFFLLPVTWVGPVIAPVINSLTMILLATVIIYFAARNRNVIIKGYHWLILIIGALTVIGSYIEDYLDYMLDKFSLAEVLGKAEQSKILGFASEYVPENFKWWIFGIGVLLHLLIIIHLIFVNRGNKSVGYEQLLGND